MTDLDPELQQQVDRAEELARAHRELRAQRAEGGDLSARVHDEAARVHEQLGDRSLLDPEELRRHAERDREMAAEERAALEREQPEN